MRTTFAWSMAFAVAVSFGDAEAEAQTSSLAAGPFAQTTQPQLQSSQPGRGQLGPGQLGPGRQGYGQSRQASRQGQYALAQQPQPLTLDNGSWTYIPKVLPRVMALNDRITVRVDELARMQSEGEAERRKDAQYDAILQDWVRLIGLKAIKPATQNDGDPRVRGQLQQLFRAEADVQTRESLALNIACTVADIRPNGDLVLEGHKQIRVNDDFWNVSLTGICRREDVGPDNVVLSRNIVNMKLDKSERGHVRDSYKRGWFGRWMDEFHPF